jgi:hypothetical protein
VSGEPRRMVRSTGPILFSCFVVIFKHDDFYENRLEATPGHCLLSCFVAIFKHVNYWQSILYDPYFVLPGLSLARK